MILFGIAKKLIDKISFGFWTIFLTFYSWANLTHAFKSLISGINPYGRIRFSFYIPSTGEVTWEGWRPNMVVETGRYHVADQLSGKLEAQMSHMAVGFGTTAVLAVDKVLDIEVDRLPLDSITQGLDTAANQVTYRCTWPADGITGPITEAGLFNSGSAGIMFCRSVFAVKNKEEGEAMVMDWILTISS